jgi:hypothetical protein
MSPEPNPPYGIFVAEYQLLSKFLRVSRESRHETLRFRRVHVPCKPTSKPQRLDFRIIGSDNTKLGVLHFSPEYDFLHITTVFSPQMSPGAIFFDFVHHVKTTYDPRHVRLLNLALNFTDLGRLVKDNLDAPSGPFSATMNQLNEFFYCIIKPLSVSILAP